MATPVVRLRRSATQGAVPTTAQLALGEVAINTYDGKLFIKKNNGTESIVEIGAGGGGGISNVVEDTTPQLGGNLDLNSNNITGTGNINITGDITATAFSGNFSVTQTSANGSYYPLLVSSISTGNRQLFVDNGQISYNPSTNRLELFNLNVNAELNLVDDVELNFGTSKDAWFNYNGTGNYLELQLESAATDFRITDNGTERFRFEKSTGNLGIGTTPTEKLDVNGTVKATTFSGSGASLTNVVNSITAGTGISVDQSTGNVTITATGTVDHKILDDISGSFDGSTTAFTLSSSSTNFINSEITSVARLMISVGGVIQQPDPTQTSGFYISGGTNISTDPIVINFVEAPKAGQDFFGVAYGLTTSPSAAFVTEEQSIVNSIVFGV